MLYTLLADLIVAIHFGIVAFIVLGQLAILAGILRGWGWVRNFWFRLAHLVGIAIVAFEAVAGIDCPLTVWEYELRTLAGQTVQEGTFLGRWFHFLLFYDAEPWVFTTGYVTFALLVLLTFLVAPPQRPRFLRRQHDLEGKQEPVKSLG